MRAKKALGQNFLVDGNLQRKIIEALDPGEDDEVLEIGPGRGALTRHLVGTCRRLVLVEVDDDLVEDLRERWGHRSDVRVIHDDILEVEPEAISEEPDRLRVVGNIPYNITTPILFHFLERPRPRDILLMVQREVADRILADAGTSEYGALAVGVRSVASVEKVLKVPRTAFRPVPGVDSSVIRVTPLRPEPLTEEEERRLRRLTRLSFQWRRKQMQKTLRDHPRSDLSRSAVAEVAERTGFDLTRRPETFSPGDFLRLAEAMGEVRGEEG